MRKVTIIGAGAVGSTTAFALAESGIVEEVVIVDINEDRAWGNATDIAHGVPLIQNVRVTSGGYEEAANSDVTVITVGVPEVIGESRLVPLQKNTEILKNIIPKIVEKSPNGKILLVTNPVDILTYVAYKISGLPKNQVLGLGTLLDTSRLKFSLSREFDLDGNSISGYVLGEHGDSQMVAWSLTKIAGVDVKEYANLVGKELPETFCDDTEADVKQSAFDVWVKKGPNCYCVADAIKTLIKGIIRNENTILPVSSLMTGEYGLNDVCISVPTIIGEEGVKKTLEPTLTKEEEEKLQLSGNLMKELIEQLDI